MSSRLTRVVKPEYLEAARRAHILGTVVMHVTVAADGTVASMFPIASPSNLVTQPVLDALKQWTYKPYEVNGMPATVDTTVRWSFGRP